VTAVNAGTLVASNATALGSTAGGTTVAAGATLNINNVAIGAENITSLNGVGVGSNGALTGTGTASLSGTVTMAAASTFGTATGSDSLALSGAVGGAFALTKVGAGTLNLSAINGYSGVTNVNGGTLTLSGANGTAIASGTFNVASGATFKLDNTAANNNNRITGAVTLTGGEFIVTGNSAAATAETVGALNVNAGFSTVTVNPDPAQNAQLTFASAARVAGATVLFRGTNLGAAAGANVANIVIPGLGLVGGNTTMFNKPIVPWAIGDTSASGSGIGFVTYNIDPLSNLANATGIRPLTVSGPNQEYANTPAAGVNVNLTASRSANDNFAVNSLLLSNAGVSTVYDYSPGGASTLTVTSGAIASLGTVGNSIEPSAAGTLTITALTDAKFFVGSGANLTLGANSAVTGNAGLSVSGLGATPGALIENRSVVLTGGLFANSGTLRLGVANAFAAQALTVRAPGKFDLNGFNDAITTLTMESGSSSGAAVTTGGGTLTLGGNVTVNANGSGAVGASISGGGFLDLGAANRNITVANGLAANDFDVATTIQVTGAFGITKLGAGTLTLESANTYTGATAVSAGTLIVVVFLVFLAFLILTSMKRILPLNERGDKKTWDSVKEGLSFVFRTKELLAAVSLDLFAVLFGGAVALVVHVNVSTGSATTIHASMRATNAP
jgi:autotransporter-associated beta strand protein